MTHPDGTFAPLSALETPVDETARVSVERPSWESAGVIFVLAFFWALCLVFAGA